ncbi:MAG TPA: energy transducer TonB [Terracidiphilus sp.]|nr:energy transducer TonB [Terracidiphilus sp.]
MRRALLTTLLSSIALTAAAAPATQPDDAAPTSRAVSSGVTAPRLVYTPHISVPATELPLTMFTPSYVVLDVNLDETGSPREIRVVHSISQVVDARVIEGVRQFRWSPAVLNNKTVPSELTLNVEVQR